MTRKMGSLATLALVGVMVLVTAGCGGTASAPPAAPAASIAPAGTAAGAGADLAALEKAAKAEGAVTIYMGQPAPVGDSLKKAFETKYPGITVAYVGFTGANIKPKVIAEIQTGQVQVDVVATGEHTFLEANASALQKISDLPAWLAFPEKFRAPTYGLTTIVVQGVITNTNLVKPGDITKWTDLADPRWKGLITLLAVRQSLSTASLYSALDKKYGDDFLRKLAAQQPNWQTGGQTASQLVASGEKAVGNLIASSFLPTLKQAGAPIANQYLDPASGAEVYTAVTAKAPHPNAGRLLMNFMLTKEGQTALNGNQLGASVMADVPGAVPLPPTYVRTDETVTQAEVNRLSTLLGSP